MFGRAQLREGKSAKAHLLKLTSLATTAPYTANPDPIAHPYSELGPRLLTQDETRAPSPLKISKSWKTVPYGKFTQNHTNSGSGITNPVSLLLPDVRATRHRRLNAILANFNGAPLFSGGHLRGRGHWATLPSTIPRLSRVGKPAKQTATH